MKRLLNNHFTQIKQAYYAIGKNSEGKAISNYLAAIKYITLETVEEFKENATRSICEIIDRIVNGESIDVIIEEIASKEKIAAIKDMTRIHGFGPANCGILYDRGFRSAEHIISKKDNLILNPQQEIGIKYFHDFETKIPRHEIDAISKYVVSVILSVDPNHKCVVVGSYRRLKEQSGDIDILITNKKNMLGQIVKKLDNFLVHNFTPDFNTSVHGTYWSNYLPPIENEKESSRCLRKIDITYTEPERWGTALLHATGSSTYNAKLRKLAIDQGYSLSQHAIKKKTFNRETKQIDVKEYKFNTEQAVYDFLRYPYVDPQRRE